MTIATILLVDDEPNVLAALRRMLADEEDFVVRTAGSAPEALAIVRSEPVDVVVTDQDMPGMPGIDLLAEVQRRQPDAMRMMLSGKADLRLANAAVNAERIYRFMVKPWNDEEMKLMLRLALRHREDRLRVRELSRLVAQQAALFSRILERYPDSQDILAAYVGADEGESPADRVAQDDDTLSEAMNCVTVP